MWINSQYTYRETFIQYIYPSTKATKYNLLQFTIMLHFTAGKVGGSDKPNVPASQQAQTVPLMFEVGCAVQFGNPAKYGTIKRIEEDYVLNKEIAEIETVSYLHSYVNTYIATYVHTYMH